MADDHVQHPTKLNGLVELTDHATDEVALCRIGAIGLNHVIQGLGLHRCVQYQQALGLGTTQHGNLFRDALVALSHASRIDQHQTLLP